MTADAAHGDVAPERERRSEARAHVARVLHAALDRQGIVDKEVASWTGAKRQVVSQWCRPGGTKHISVADAVLVRDTHARVELAKLVVGPEYRVVRAPTGRTAIAADVATAGRLIRRHAALIERYIGAHEDGELTPMEKRDLRDLIGPLVDDLVGLDATLAADELPGERR